VIDMEQRSLKLSLAVAAALLVAGASVRAEDAPPPDMSNWKCSKCEFDKGYTSDTQIGAGYLDDASAKFGDYTGLDDDGAYVVAGAEGGAALESGYRLDYRLENLGLDSREIAIEGGKQGAYEFGLSYDRVPHHLSDTGETVYGGIGSRDLTLPAGWVDAGSTAGMTSLGSSLHPVEPGYDRDRYGLFGRIFLGPNWSFGLDYKRDERSGTRPKYGSFGSVSVETLRPVDDSTDRVRATVRYQGAHWYAQVGYYASIYQDQASTYRFDNPFTAPVAGGEVGQAALEPDNSYNEVAASLGWYGLPWNTAITLSGAVGKATQDNGFAPYTINPNIAVDALPFANLDGSVDVTRADLTIASRPLDRLRLRGAVAYDERDNNSRQGTFTSIVHTDLFPVTEDRVNAIYGYERTRLTGSADFDVYDDLTVGVGGEYRTTDRTGTKQEVMSETLQDGYGRVQFRPSGYVGFVVKGGVEERDPDKYDADLGTALYGQNPLMRKYQMSYRYRSYGELVANVALGTLPLSLGANVYYGDDSYLQSDMGLIAGLDRRFGVDLNWAVSEKISTYLSATREKIDSKTKNSSIFAAPDWRGDLQDNFDTYGAGMDAQVAARWRVNLDYTYALGHQRTQIVGIAAGSFPLVESKLSSFKAGLTYTLNPRTDLMASWWYETLDTSDWAFASQPDAMPTVLGLGVDPYNYSVNYVTLSMRYRFGGPQGEEAAAE
jgi:MtrB/PioB family decaheme-associated outer membrane protein